MRSQSRIPAKYQPKGFTIIYEDDAIIVGDKAPGVLTVGAAWERIHTVHHALNQYVRKGNSRSRKCVYVVHRLDQATSGLLIFAKTESVQMHIKNNWDQVTKTYYAVVHGHLPQGSGTLSSYLTEDEDYVVHTTNDPSRGRLSHTVYEVLSENAKFSLLKINLLTGRKNQIRVHLAAEGHPLVGDAKYGRPDTRYHRLALHAQNLVFPHPVNGEHMSFESAIPDYFATLVRFRSEPNGHSNKKLFAKNTFLANNRKS